jgi:hypothetical protein
MITVKWVGLDGGCAPLGYGAALRAGQDKLFKVLNRSDYAIETFFRCISKAEAAEDNKAR